MALTLAARSGSRLLTWMEAFCSKMAQQSGVAKVKMMPQRPICRGALIRGYLKNRTGAVNLPYLCKPNKAPSGASMHGTSCLT